MIHGTTSSNSSLSGTGIATAAPVASVAASFAILARMMSIRSTVGRTGLDGTISGKSDRGMRGLDRFAVNVNDIWIR